MSETDNTHRLTIRIPSAVWNATKFAALKSNRNYNATVVQALKQAYGEIDNLNTIKVNFDA